jgi:hypothetical protein
MTTALEGGEESASRPGCCLPPGKTQYPLYRRLGGPQGRPGEVRKISLLPGFDPRTVQPAASCYTGYATRPTITYLWTLFFKERRSYGPTLSIKLNQQTKINTVRTPHLGEKLKASKHNFSYTVTPVLKQKTFLHFSHIVYLCFWKTIISLDIINY